MSPTRRQLYACLACFQTLMVVTGGMLLYKAAAATEPGWAVFWAVITVCNAIGLIGSIEVVGKE